MTALSRELADRIENMVRDGEVRTYDDVHEAVSDIANGYFDSNRDAADYLLDSDNEAAYFEYASMRDFGRRIPWCEMANAALERDIEEDLPGGDPEDWSVCTCAECSDSITPAESREYDSLCEQCYEEREERRADEGWEPPYVPPREQMPFPEMVSAGLVAVVAFNEDEDIDIEDPEYRVPGSRELIPAHRR